MRLGFVTYQIAESWDLPTIIKKCQALGLEGVELRTTHAHGVEPTLNRAHRAELRKRFIDAGLTLWGLGTTCEFHALDPAEVRHHVDVAKQFIELAADLGAVGVKVRPNGLQEQAGVPKAKTLEQIGRAYRECGAFGQEHGVELWMEVHGQQTSEPVNIRTIIQAADHENCFVCWNSNAGETDESGSIRSNFLLLGKWIRSCHINELWNAAYPWRELFGLLKECSYGERFTLAEIPGSSDPDRLLRYYRALWLELTSPAP